MTQVMCACGWRTDEFHVVLDCSSHLLRLADVIECRIPESLNARSATASGRPDTRDTHNEATQGRSVILSAHASARHRLVFSAVEDW